MFTIKSRYFRFEVIEEGPFEEENVITSFDFSIPYISQISGPHMDCIKKSWIKAKKENQKKGFYLYSGKLCKLQEVQRDDNTLKLSLSKTTYREYIGTRSPSIIKKFNLKHEYRSDPLAICSVVISSDAKMIIIKRNPMFVDAMPDHYDVPGGFIHQPYNLNVNPFKAIQRELKEEFGIRQKCINKIICLGLVYDNELLHPELVMETLINISAHELINHFKKTKLDNGEVGKLIVLNNLSDELYNFIYKHHKRLSPTGEANLFLYGVQHHGKKWRAMVEKKIFRAKSQFRRS